MYYKLTEKLRDDIWFINHVLNKKETGLSCNIWLICEHNDIIEPCVFFQNDYSEKPLSYSRLENLISVRIRDQKILLNNEEKININIEDVNNILLWIKKYKKIILKYWYGKIDSCDLIDIISTRGIKNENIQTIFNRTTRIE